MALVGGSGSRSGSSSGSLPSQRSQYWSVSNYSDELVYPIARRGSAEDSMSARMLLQLQDAPTRSFGVAHLASDLTHDGVSHDLVDAILYVDGECVRTKERSAINAD